MRGKGVSGDYPGCNTRSRNCRLKSSRVEGNLDNVVIIDVDTGNVYVPERLQQKLGGSTVLPQGRKFPFEERIVCLDDDDDDDLDDDDDEVDPLENNVEGDHELDNDGTESESNTAGDSAERFVDGDDDDCQVVNKKAHPFKLSKCKRTCAEKTTGRNHYGLYSECESDSSHSDSDCEVIDGSSGEFRENWEKATKRRSAYKNRQRHEDQAVPCSSHETDTNAEAEKKTDKNTEPCTNSENNSYGVFTGTLDGEACDGSCNVGLKTFVTTFNGKVDGATFPRWCKPRTPRNMNSSGKADNRGETSGRDSDDTYDERQHMNDFRKRSAPKETSCARRSSHEECDTHFHRTQSFYQNGEQTSSEKTSEFETWDSQGEGISSVRARQSAETQNFNRSKVFSRKKDKMSFASSSGPEIYSDGIEATGSGDKNKEFHGQDFSFHGFHQSEENVIENVVVGSSEHKGKAVLEESFIHVHENPGHRDEDKTDAAGRSFYRTRFDESASRVDSVEASIVSEQKDPFAGPKSNLKLNDDRDPSSTTVIDPTTVVQENIINDREKLKETDEYRRAMEEEWAARQRQLKIQAEEAQRQRKRKKAESLRVLEMEKRQKQRLEEVRESQKKVEENLNMKERLRTEVRNEICRLEVMCNDMASLLRGLGIQVGGGPFPSSDEVHAAYKRALLKFHPDRASRTDIQKQVEAEEKFKLISRMKEKFLSTSC